VAGQQTLSATYTLPSGALQAVRAQFRYQGAASSCTSGGYNDRDDLVFAVTSTAPVTVFEDTFETDKAGRSTRAPPTPPPPVAGSAATPSRPPRRESSSSGRP
jgi:hypothetical protein